jgi:hypothetical protein
MTAWERGVRQTIFHLVMPRKAPMKTLFAGVLLLTISGAAFAKLDPLVKLVPAASARFNDDADINIGPAGAMLERDYFQAPRAFSVGAFPCRFEPSMFAKVHLAQSCH